MPGERTWLEDASQWSRETAEELDLDKWQKRLLLRRWFEEVERYNRLWRWYRLIHYVLAVTTIVVGLSIPFLVAINAADWSVALAGLVVGIFGALEGFFGLNDRWQHMRTAAMRIHNEGLRFIEKRDPYGGQEHRISFPSFLENLERINEVESEGYVGLFRSLPSADEARRLYRTN